MEFFHSPGVGVNHPFWKPSSAQGIVLVISTVRVDVNTNVLDLQPATRAVFVHTLSRFRSFQSWNFALSCSNRFAILFSSALSPPCCALVERVSVSRGGKTNSGASMRRKKAHAAPSETRSADGRGIALPVMPFRCLPACASEKPSEESAQHLKDLHTCLYTRALLCTPLCASMRACVCAPLLYPLKTFVLGVR